MRLAPHQVEEIVRIGSFSFSYHFSDELPHEAQRVVLVIACFRKEHTELIKHTRTIRINLLQIGLTIRHRLIDFRQMVHDEIVVCQANRSRFKIVFCIIDF